MNAILISAIEKGASDVYIEPTTNELFVRYRIDGVLYNIMQPPLKFRDAIISCIKRMARFDPERVRQQGRIDVRFRDGSADGQLSVVVSCEPTRFGEEIRLSVLPAVAGRFSE